MSRNLSKTKAPRGYFYLQPQNIRSKVLGITLVSTLPFLQIGCGSSASDAELDVIIADQNLTENPALARDLPDISDPIAQLGMALFYSKSLGGAMDAACVTCHHPGLGGADGLSFSVGVDSLDSDVLGQGRTNSVNLPSVPRNAPSVFNAGLWDSGLFLDSRVESLGKEIKANGAVSPIRTPDSDFLTADANAGENLVVAQSKFPVTSSDEMKTESFESGSTNDEIRDHLAARIGDYGIGEGELPTNTWLEEFQTAFASSEGAEALITFDNIAFALGEFERSMVFVDTPWHQYVNGDLLAITEDQKQGALLFFTPVNEGGAGCSGCHRGDAFTDEQHHTIAFPQIGVGKGDGNNDDFGRERETGNPADRYRFRTASLLNVALTAPYGHAGTYQTLEEVVRHYVNPVASVNAFFDRGGWCQLPQFQTIDNCETLYPDSMGNSQLVLQKLGQERQAGVTPFISPALDNSQIAQLVSFLESLTDDCAGDRECLSAWVPAAGENGPDGNQLNAVDLEGNVL